MKSCTYCGKEYPDEVFVCAVDGQPLTSVIPTPPAPGQPPVSDRQQIIDSEHLKLLSIFHFVVAGLAFCGIAFTLVHYLIMRTVFANPDIWKSQANAPQLPKDFFKMFVWFYLFIGMALVTACISA